MRSHNFSFPSSASAAAQASTPLYPDTEAEASSFPTLEAWDLSFVPDFFPQHSVLSSLVASEENVAHGSAPFQTHPRHVDGGQPVESAKRRRNESYSSPFTPAPNTTSHPAEHTSAGPTLAGSMFSQLQVRNSAELGEVQLPSYGFTSSPDGTSLTEKTLTNSHLTGDISSTTSHRSLEHENSYEPVNLAKAPKAITANPLQLAFSETSAPSKSQSLELVEIFFSDYHQFLPCIHKKTFVERVKRGELTDSDPLLWAIMAVAAPSHSDHHLQALQHSWLSRARLLFDKNLIASNFPTRSLQAAVWIVFGAYISAELTEAWFFLGKACRLAHFLGLDRIDCGRSERLISVAPPPRDALELEERRKTIWVLFFLDRSLSCLAGFSLAIDDRQFHVNYPVDDAQFQAFTHSVCYTRHPLCPLSCDT